MIPHCFVGVLLTDEVEVPDNNCTLLVCAATLASGGNYGFLANKGVPAFSEDIIDVFLDSIRPSPLPTPPSIEQLLVAAAA